MADNALPSLQRLDADEDVQVMKIRSPFEHSKAGLFSPLRPQATLTLFASRTEQQTEAGENEIQGMEK